MAKPVILFYDPLSSPWAGKLKQLCALQGLRLRPVEPGETGSTLQALAFGGQAASSPAAPVPEPMLILCGFSAPQLDKILTSLRKAGVPRSCLKAVLTPANAEWTLSALYRELCLERAQLEGNAPTS